MSKRLPPLTAAQVASLVEEHFPQLQDGVGQLSIERIDALETVVRMSFDERLMRPGGSVSGPAMFKLADFGVYAAILGRLGEAGLQAVTTSMTINFLSRPQPAAMLAHIRVLKMGRRLAVCDVSLYCEGAPELVAHATSTYAVPPERMRG